MSTLAIHKLKQQIKSLEAHLCYLKEELWIERKKAEGWVEILTEEIDGESERFLFHPNVPKSILDTARTDGSFNPLWSGLDSSDYYDLNDGDCHYETE